MRKHTVWLSSRAGHSAWKVACLEFTEGEKRKAITADRAVEDSSSTALLCCYEFDSTSQHTKVNRRPTMGYARKDVEKTKASSRKFVRYQEGAERYSLGLTKFKELAIDAGAVYKVGKVALVNCEIFEQYLELFRTL